ncbi:MAG: DUF3604 domain-containing protein [Pseudomonadales bacterium]
MIKNTLLGLLLVSLAVYGVSWLVGSGAFYEVPPAPSPVAQARPPKSVSVADAISIRSQILFGDLHVHTSYSIDAAIIDTPASKGTARTTPADACDYARYCSGLDFWSINDHAEGLTPWQWQSTREAIRQCNAASDPMFPDMVSFLGWEWTQGGDRPENHYGHKNVMFLDQEEGKVPVRAIGSGENSLWRWLGNLPAAVRGLGILAGSRLQISEYRALAHHLESVGNTLPCGKGKVRDLQADCHESASTPTELFQKLDDWGFEAMVIPHGLSWSTTNPIGSDFKYQMNQLNNKYQNLLEVYSGHGNSEVYRDLPIVMPGSEECPVPMEGFTACCWQAGTIIHQRCTANAGQDCDERARNTRTQYRKAMTGTVGASPHRTVVRDTVPDDWGQCDQLVDSFQPSHNYQALQSAQYILSLNGEDGPFRPGFIGSSDNHTARPGNSYKETSRYYVTDTKAKPGPQPISDVSADRPQEPVAFTFEDDEDAANGFFYTGGLVAVHSKGRDRQAIWNALRKKSVYGTSGPRISLWFDLIDEAGKSHGMGSELSVTEPPRFRVSAKGSLKQKPGCPAYVTDVLGASRTASLCRNECQNPSDEVHKIERIEVVRILPQRSADQKQDEKPSELIQDPWRVFDCDAGIECSVEFSDDEFLEKGRDAVYYVRAIQEATETIQGDPFHCERSDAGQCAKTNYCIGVDINDDCLAPAEHRAWSSPIYVSVAKGVLLPDTVTKN